MLIIQETLGNIKVGCAKRFSWTGGCGSVVECLPSEFKLLGLIFNPAKKNKNVYYFRLKFLGISHQRVILNYLFSCHNSVVKIR